MKEHWTKEDEADNVVANQLTSSGFFRSIASLAILPLVSDEFLSSINEAKLKEAARAMQQLRDESAETKLPDLALDAALRSIYRQLGQADELAEAEKRINENPFASVLPPDEDLKNLLEEFQQFPVGD